MKWVVEVEQGEIVPDWYGVAYWRYDRPVAIAMPVPFNVIVCWYRTLVWWLRFPPGIGVERLTYRIRQQALREGFDIGRRGGFLEP